MAKKKFHSPVGITDKNGKMPKGIIQGTYPPNSYLPDLGIDMTFAAGDSFVKESQNAISKKSRKTS